LPEDRAQGHVPTHRRIAAHEVQHRFDQTLHVLEAFAEATADPLALLRREIRPRQLCEVQGGGGQGRADLVRQARRHLTHGGQALPASELLLQFVHLRGIGDQYHLLAGAAQGTAVDRQVTAAGAAVRAQGRVACGDRGPALTEQRLAEEVQGLGVGIAHGGGGIQQHHAAGQGRNQFRQAGQETRFLGELAQAGRTARGELLREPAHLPLQIAIAAVELPRHGVEGCQRIALQRQRVIG
jgi:hypothetical protein